MNANSLEQKRSVWIVGAGFSRHAGGPLMPDLFSTMADEMLNFWNPTGTDSNWKSNQREREAINDTLKSLKRIAEGFRQLSKDENSMKSWENAEQFLERLDEYSNTSNFENFGESRIERIKSKMNLKFDPYEIALVRICKEVNDYLVIMDKRSERWSPYVHWAQSIRNDVILSFNYDTLVERAFNFANREITVPKPTEDPKSGSPNLLKLHGSVNWGLDSKGVFIEIDDFSGPVTFPLKHKPIIATPGASKGRHVSQFPKLWEFAEASVKVADVVHIVGYRFPETDSSAVLRLINAMRSIKSGGRINIVLGIDVERDEVKRLEKLINYNVADNSVEVAALPFFAQDYLTMDHAWTPKDRGSKFVS
ncbi:MAG: SIR2 family protein [Pirellulaceae bacterium]